MSKDVPKPNNFSILWYLVTKIIRINFFKPAQSLSNDFEFSFNSEL